MQFQIEQNDVKVNTVVKSGEWFHYVLLELLDYQGSRVKGKWASTTFTIWPWLSLNAVDKKIDKYSRLLYRRYQKHLAKKAFHRAIEDQKVRHALIEIDKATTDLNEYLTHPVCDVRNYAKTVYLARRSKK